MAKYEIGTKVKKRDNYYGASFLAGEIVAQHKHGRWIVEVTEPLTGKEALKGDLLLRAETILDEYYEVVKPEAFFSLGDVYQFGSNGGTKYTIIELYVMPNDSGEMVNYAVARVVSKYDGEFPEILSAYEFSKMVKV